ncbi:MAG: hypothetical protein K2Q20_04575 [Phycisphaerales bacterium]|nr:hypothetical protein [Phycisphaerales bacterium]
MTVRPALRCELINPETGRAAEWRLLRPSAGLPVQAGLIVHARITDRQRPGS